MSNEIFPLSLYSILQSNQVTEDTVNGILRSFISREDSNGQPHEVQDFLHRNAITFEKAHFSRTYLMMETIAGHSQLSGYFTIANKNLTISRDHFLSLPKPLRRHLMSTRYNSQDENNIISGLLIGQIGINFNPQVRSTSTLNGDTLLESALLAIYESHDVSGGRIVYLECEDNDQLKAFYTRNNFSEIPDYKSPNGLCVMFQKLSRFAN
jgi:hypothetical protein